MLQASQRQATHLYSVLDETLKMSFLWRTWSCRDRIYFWRFREQRFEDNFWLKAKISWDSFMRNRTGL